MAVFPQEGTRSNDHIHTIHTSLYRNLDVRHCTSRMCKNLGLETELADSLAIEPALLTRTWVCELNAVDTKSIQGLGNSDLGLGIKVGIGELFTLSQGRLDDLEFGDVRQEVADGLVGISVFRCLGRVYGSFDAGEAFFCY